MMLVQTVSVLERAMHNKGRTLAPAAAREFLEWKLSEQDDRRLDELGAKNKQGELSEAETEELLELCNTVDLLSLLHLYAREAIGDMPKTGV